MFSESLFFLTWCQERQIWLHQVFSSPEPLIWWAYRIGKPLSSIVVRRPHSLNSFSSETTGPVKVKFHMELLWDGGTKAYSNGPGHMTKMAAMPIHGKNLNKSSSPEPKGWWPWILVCIIGCSSTTEFAQMRTLGWPWPILQQGRLWSLMLLYWKKVNNGFFRNYCCLWFEINNRWLTWQEVSFDIKTCPLGAVCPLSRGCIHVLNH